MLDLLLTEAFNPKLQVFNTPKFNSTPHHCRFFFQYAGLRSSDVPSIQEWMETLLHKIRPNAVGIVDGFDISDAVLRSALGAYDGNVYERLFAEANKSPLNAEPVDESFHKYLKPFLKSNL